VSEFWHFGGLGRGYEERWVLYIGRIGEIAEICEGNVL
jgi:hypothetical protein